MSFIDCHTSYSIKQFKALNRELLQMKLQQTKTIIERNMK